MNFVDLLKKSVINEFTGTISIDKIVLSLITAFIIGIFIIYIYKKTYSGVVYSKSFSLCIILLAMVTALIIRTINSNLALSLGMVGALSIVRFRTAVKEPVDTGFMFLGNNSWYNGWGWVIFNSNNKFCCFRFIILC